MIDLARVRQIVADIAMALDEPDRIAQVEVMFERAGR